MKRLLNPIAALSLVVVLVAGLASCSPSPQEMLAQTWAIEDIESSEEIPEGMEEMYESMMDEMKKSSSFTFNADNTFDASFSGMESSGTWSLNDDATVLSMTDENGETDDADVTIASDKLVFTIAEGGSEMTMTMVPKGGDAEE